MIEIHPIQDDDSPLASLPFASAQTGWPSWRWMGGAQRPDTALHHHDRRERVKKKIMGTFSIFRMIFDAMLKPKQHIVLQEIPPGTVLDIGGGGEGVVAQLGGARVVAVDKYLSEIHEAREKALPALWLAADATTLPCENQSFDHATAFFSGMYMTNETKGKVFQEARRVLKPGGELWIWDANMPPKGNVFTIRLQIDLGDRQVINTTYGVRAKEQSAASIDSLLREAGFEPQLVADQKHWFMIKARKV